MDLAFLKGKKTYIAATLTVIGAVAAVLDGDMKWQAALDVIVPAIMSVTVRNGITTEAAKTRDAVVESNPQGQLPLH